MIFKGHFIALANLLFTEYSAKSRTIKLYMITTEVFTIEASQGEYDMFLEALADIFGGAYKEADTSIQ